MEETVPKSSKYDEKWLATNYFMTQEVKDGLKTEREQYMLMIRAGRVPTPIDCTEELAKAHRRTSAECEKIIVEYNSFIKLIEVIEQQKHQHQPPHQKRDIISVQVILWEAKEKKFAQLDKLLTEMEEFTRKYWKQRSQRHKELLQEYKQMADAEQEMANILKKPELNAKQLQRVRVLRQKSQQHNRRIRECQEVFQQVTEYNYFHQMVKEQEFKDDERQESYKRAQQLALQNLKNQSTTDRKYQVQTKKEYQRFEENSMRCNELNASLVHNQQHIQPEVTFLPPKSQPIIKLSGLSRKQHDDLMIYKIFNDRALKKRIRNELPITQVIQFMTSISPGFFKEINQTEKDEGNYAAVKKFFQLLAVRSMKPGWSHQLLLSMDKLAIENLKQSLIPTENDLVDFLKRSGVPRNSLLEQISCHLRKDGDVLLTPMGRKSYEDVPIVHSELCLSQHINSRNEIRMEAISFQDIVESYDQTLRFTNQSSTMLRNKHSISLFLVGIPGSGKSTMAKRMVKAYNEDNKIAFYIPLQNVEPDQPLNLKSLLLKVPLLLNGNENSSPNKIERDFELVLGNQNKCLVVFDGLDEVEFQITDPPVGASIDDELPLGQLLSLILSRRFLPEARIITACRPFPQSQLPTSIQPEAYVFVGELPDAGLQTLIKHYIPSEDSGSILETLKKKSIQIFDLIHIPLFFQLFVMLYRDSGDRIWLQGWTTAKLFSETIKNHQYSANFNKQNMIEVLNSTLGKVAYSKTMKTMDQSTVFEERELDDLSADDVQDFMGYFLVKSSSLNNSSSLTKLFVFHHLSVQEYLAAEFALKSLSVDEFEDFLTKIFPRVSRSEETNLEKLLPNAGVRGRLEIGEDKFANVRMLTISCLNELDTSTGEMVRKRQMFVQRMCNHLRKIFMRTRISSEVEDYQFTIMKDLMELTKDDIVAQFREDLKFFDFWFGKFHFRVDVAYSRVFRHFLARFVSSVKSLLESTTNLKRVSDLINSFNGKIEEANVKVAVNTQRSSNMPQVGDIIAIFPKLERKLILELFDTNPELLTGNFWKTQCGFWKKLNDEIGKFDTSSLQTEKLELNFRSTHRLYLSCTLQRGETPPKFLVYEVVSEDGCKVRSFMLQ